MQVHDELVLEVPAGDEAAIGERIRAFMAAAADLDVPLEVEVGIGDDWETAH
jgi:DNA polymerase-1